MAKTVNAAPVKLKLLITVVNKSKADFYADLIQSFEVNLQFLSLARGTALADVMNYLGLSDSEKAVVFSVVREDRLDEICELLEEKFRTVKNGKGVAFAVPFTGVIGKSAYGFLANVKETLGGAQ